MKRLLILLLLLPSLAWGEDYARMNPYVLGAGVSAAADGPNAWYYSCTETPTVEPAQDDYANVSTGYAYCGSVVVPTGGSLTKIAFHRPTNDSQDSPFKLGIYDTSGNYQTGMTCTIPSTTSNGWLECSLGSPVAISAATYRICAVADPGHYFSYNNDFHGYYDSTAPYADFPEASYAQGQYDLHCLSGKLYVD